MFMEKIRKLKNKKGFTLVELIVVLVILVILMSMLMPALTGYIQRATNAKLQAATRTVATAAQAASTEQYGISSAYRTTIKVATAAAPVDVKADTNFVKSYTPFIGSDLPTGYEVKNINVDADGTIVSVIVSSGGKKCTYKPTATDDVLKVEADS